MRAPDTPERRREALPSIRASTDCIAKETLNVNGVVEAYRSGDLSGAIASAAKFCEAEIRRMMSAQDRIFGYGQGRVFYQGAYLNDLSRAVLTRVKDQLEARRVEDDRRRAALYEERQRRDAERRVELARLENERKVQELRSEQLRQQRLEAVQGATGLLRDRAMDCVGREVRDMVRSGETADVLATAAMTICSTEITRFVEAFIQEKGVENNSTLGSAEAELFKEVGRAKVREQVVAIAVKAKAAR